jgi:hypothetical protein
LQTAYLTFLFRDFYDLTVIDGDELFRELQCALARYLKANPGRDVAENLFEQA